MLPPLSPAPSKDFRQTVDNLNVRVTEEKVAHIAEMHGNEGRGGGDSGLAGLGLIGQAVLRQVRRAF